MENTNNKKLFKFIEYYFPVIRIFLYLALYISFIIIPVEIIERKSLCETYNKLNIVCFSCGVTRAFSNLMHFNFTRAINFNPLFTLGLFPIATIVFVQDTYIYFKRIICKKELVTKYSLLENLFIGLFK